jgi:hypothetical protein
VASSLDTRSGTGSRFRRRGPDGARRAGTGGSAGRRGGCLSTGVAAGYAQHADPQRVEPVWTGPISHAVPVRSTAQVLVDVVAAAHSELLLITYSVKLYPPLLTALNEPAAAFASVPSVQLWHWPVTCRAEPGTKMHAKLSVADWVVLLVSSANLTFSGVSTTFEAGSSCSAAPLRYGPLNTSASSRRGEC